MDSLFELLGISRGLNVLDVGFGPPSELFAISNLVGDEGMVYGVELDKSRLETALGQIQDTINIRVMPGSSHKIPLSNQSVDIVLLKDVLHEVPIVSQALSEAGRVCGSTGKIAIVDFTAFPENWLRWSNLKWRLQRPWKIFALSPDKHSGFSRTELLSYLEDSGLSLEKYEDNFLRGGFSGHRVPMFLAVAKTRRAL